MVVASAKVYIGDSINRPGPLRIVLGGGRRMSPFIIGILVFFLLCLGMGALIFYAVRSQGRREFKISRRAFVYSMLIPVMLGVVFLGFFAFYEWH